MLFRSGRASHGPTLCPPAATPTPWMACTVWPEKVRGEVLCTVGAGAASNWDPGAGLGRALLRTWGEAGGVWAGHPTSSLSPTEGLKKLFSGATMASSRGMLVTVGQVGLPLGVGLGQHLGGLASAL